jgi:hypothetical protein
MSLFDHLINYELCFPGVITGSTEINCPRCGELLTVPVDDPMGQDTFLCYQCNGAFAVDCDEGTITIFSGANPSKTTTTVDE